MSTKEAYQQKMRAKLDEWEAEIKILEAKADRAQADVKQKYNEQIGNLRTNYEEARKRLAELRESGEGAWEILKEGVERSWKELGDAVETAASKFEK